MSLNSGSQVTPSQDKQILEQIAGISDVSQFVQGVQTDPAVIIDAIKAMKMRNEEAEAELESARRRIKKLEKKPSSPGTSTGLSINEDLMSRLVVALEGRNTSRTALLPEAHVFTGARKDFYNWKESVLMKIKGNLDHYPTEQSRMIYVYSRMNSESQTHLQNWVQDGSLLFPTLAHMMDQLTIIFGDPHRVRDAASRLHLNAQKNKSFGTWIAEIRRDAAIAGYESNSRYLRDLVLNKLSSELKKALVYERDIEHLGFDEVASRLQDIENRLRSCANTEFRSSFRNGGSYQPIVYPEPAVQPISPRHTGDPMDLSATMSRKKRKYNSG